LKCKSLAISTDAYTVTKIELWPIDIPLDVPFVVATGRRLAAENLFIRITLKSGTQGYGESAPFPEVGGHDRPSCLRVATELARASLGEPAVQYRHLARRFYEMAADQPAARCGLETALVDAVARELGIALWALWGGADLRERETDITIPIASPQQTLELGRKWYSKGFRLFKTKVGASQNLVGGQPDTVEEDIQRVTTLHQHLSGAAFIVDANQGFTREQCLHFVKEACRMGVDLRLLEQPVAKDDLDSLAALRRDTGVPIAADESVRSLQDIRDLIRKEAVDFINIKIMKSGLISAMDIAAYARASGLRLMIGGMIETRVAMGCSFALVLGTGGYEVLDLDTPLLMGTDPVQGGYRYRGPKLQPSPGPGLDIELEVPRSATIIE
jgi:L-alanine-DL-glutamate epimerase-like enolase superfamily enzyme